MIYEYVRYNKIPNYIINFLWYLVYYYSRLQIYFKQKNIKLIKSKLYQKYEYVKDGNIILITESNKKNPDLNYDFIIFSENDIMNDNIVNNIILNNDLDNIKYENADYKFIMSVITIKNVIIQVSFKTNEYNFLIVNNKIDKKFINYFLKKYYNNFIKNLNDLEIENYSIQIIDQNADLINFDSSKTLIINKNNYVCI